MTKAVILAGGLGTRLAEETSTKPKPMVEIGGKPILWHIMKIYSAHGINDFIVCLGYKGYVIKEYFLNYYFHMSDVTIDLGNNTVETHNASAEPWRITLVDTGELTMTGGRLKRVLPYVANDPFFCMTYGDGVGNINITKSIEFHKKHGLQATVTGTQPPGRFGALALDGDKVTSFMEKPAGDGNWINGGFFVLSPQVSERIAGDETTWEKEPLEGLAESKQLALFRHSGFWQPMDSLRDKITLEEAWSTNKAQWKIW
ncbi:glucose-1-phosphate cytidylyltransferase [Entomobacter blattae]|uniref:Glucose-1-phosphate cytidylyltransferase n=1 Tax=Entomobacter blattae TaxID=2762277 RepID=A0A7H1NPV9_9PROT|nr:glucose-1-phosphate cytidylyltransferase [Entomobacter blattae]QNT77819.1 Glucose-1-phosphate cytidylyltransferase [Entomobacter blattae]